jgi:hypothetical protein
MRLASLLPLVGFLALTAACDEEDDATTYGATMHTDGYALFSVDNNRQQRDQITATITSADPGATYILLYSEDQPKDTGWFQFDPSTKQRCGGEVGDHCLIDGYGYMVDEMKVPDGQTSVTLRDERCGCDANNEDKDWSGHWAVMRIERTNTENKISFEVAPHKLTTFTTEPDVHQLQ